MKKEEKKKIINKIDLFFSYTKQKKISQLLAISFFILSIIFYKNYISCIFLLLCIIFLCLSHYIHLVKMRPASLEVLFDKNFTYGKFIDKKKLLLYIILILRKSNKKNDLDDFEILFIENIKKIKIKSTNKQ
jgi:hypothetical protein